ncbi:MAG: transcriptional regulator with DNA-binding domain and aminotransferase domain [Sphingobacteriales bacterium]|nr:transcriptional regulator with DNA-binding domain and aminotransferase domain [Sphingobacteriales bacterium]
MNTLNNQLFADRVNHVPKSFIREILKVASMPDITSFAGGLPNPLLFPVNELSKCAEKLFRERGVEVLQYGASEGYYPLREIIANRYNEKQNLNITAENILITNGSQQALDLIGKVFINPGDEVLLERPTYLGALQCFGMFESHYREVSFNDGGLDIDQLRIELTDGDVKLFYSVPNFQNPTGGRYTLENRLDIVNTLKEHDLVTIEDDPYGEISFSGDLFPTLYSFRPDKTILLGSFSKVISPGLRVGWIVANKEIISKLIIMKQASDLHTSNLTQQILYEYLTKYNLDQHISQIRKIYKNQRDVMFEAIQKYFPADVLYTKPEGGMFIWLTLPHRFNARKLLQLAMNKGIVFVPGDTFYASKPDEQTLRLNFSNIPENKITKSMKILGELLNT